MENKGNIDKKISDACVKFNDYVKPAIEWMKESIKHNQNMDLMIDFCRFNYYISYYLKLMDLVDCKAYSKSDIYKMNRMLDLYNNILKTQDTDELAAMTRWAMRTIITDMSVDYYLFDQKKMDDLTDDNLGKLLDMEVVNWASYESYAIPIINTLLHEVDGEVVVREDPDLELLAQDVGSSQYLAYAHIMEAMEDAAQSHILFEEIQEKMDANKMIVQKVYERETAI